MANKQPPRMFFGGNRPSSASRTPKKEAVPVKNALEEAKVESTDTPLYHGTAHVFKQGEMLEPRDSVNARFRKSPLRSLYGATVPSSVRTTDYTYSTSNLDTARGYALQAAEEKGQKFAPVYQVEPTGDTYSLRKLLGSRDPKGPKYTEELLKTHENSIISDKPMVPQSIVSWVENPAGTRMSPQFDAIVKAHSAMLGRKD